MGRFFDVRRLEQCPHLAAPIHSPWRTCAVGSFRRVCRVRGGGGVLDQSQAVRQNPTLRSQSMRPGKA